jgi:anti-sigma-K factor RskA
MVVVAMDARYARPLPSSAGPQGSGQNGPVVAAPSRAEARAAALDHLSRPVELRAKRRFSTATLAGLAAAAGVAAIVLGGWAFVSGVRTDAGSGGVGAAPDGLQQAVALLARRDVERLPLRGSVGRIVLVVEAASGHAALVLNGLGAVEPEWAYQAWVTGPNALAPRSAALFSGREAIVPLTGVVRRGAVVAVTLEPAAGSFGPTRTPKLLVERPA